MSLLLLILLAATVISQNTFVDRQCVLRLEDIDMETFMVDISKDVAIAISVVPITNTTLNETECDLSDPNFFSSLTLAYNLSNLESVLSYARFVDSLNATATSFAGLIALSNPTKETVSISEVAKLVSDLLMSNYNNTHTYTGYDVVFYLMATAFRAAQNINFPIYNATLKKLDEPVYGWENMPKNMLSMNEISRGIIDRNSINNTLLNEFVYQRPYTIFEQIADAGSAFLFRSQPYDKYGFRRATPWELFSAWVTSGELNNFKWRASMLINQRIASFRSVPLKAAFINGWSVAISQFRSSPPVFRPEFGSVSGRAWAATSAMMRSLPAISEMVSRAWYDNSFRFTSTARTLRSYESLVSSMQRLGGSPSLEAAADHNQIIAQLWAAAFLPDSSTDIATQTPEFFELADIFSVRYWFDPNTSWQGFAPGDRKVLRMSGLTILPIPTDTLNFLLWWLKYLGRSTVFQGIFDLLGIESPFGNSSTSPFGVTNVTLCLPAPGWFPILPDPAFGCEWPTLGPAPVVFESTDAFLDYVVSMLITNWTKYDPWLNPLDKIPAVLQLIVTAVLNETLMANPPLATVFSWVEVGVNWVWPTWLLPFRITNQNMPKYAWLTLLFVVPVAGALLIAIVILLYGSCIGYCIPTIQIFFALGDKTQTVTGGLKAQLKLAQNAAFGKTMHEFEKLKAELKKPKTKKQQAKRKVERPPRVQPQVQLRVQEVQQPKVAASPSAPESVQLPEMVRKPQETHPDGKECSRGGCGGCGDDCVKAATALI